MTGPRIKRPLRISSLNQRTLMRLVPDSESKNASIMLILVYFVWFGERCTLFCTRSPF